MNERTVQCPICKEPYKVFSMYAGDQSACPQCRAKAEKKLRKSRQRPFTLSVPPTRESGEIMLGIRPVPIPKNACYYPPGHPGPLPPFET